MTKEEIIKEIGYTGKYTKEVKRKLKKLLKIYHPDNNKKDKKTILLLYEVKKELEKGTLKYKKSNKKESIVPKEERKEVSKEYINFLETMILRMKRRKYSIDKKILAVYKKINAINKKKYSKERTINKIDLEISILLEEINNMLKINSIDIILAMSILLLLSTAIIFKSIFLFIIMVLLITIEMYYIIIRRKEYNKNIILLKHAREKLQKHKKIFDKIKNDVEILKKEENILKSEYRRINNDIEFYNYELSKAKSEIKKEYSKEKGYQYKK